MSNAAYITQLPPGARSFGARAGVMSENLGEPFLPHQFEAARLASAVHPDDPNRWRYNLIVITWPRQSGKTTWARAIHTDRLMFPRANPFSRERVTLNQWMTAQQGKDARERWISLQERIQSSPVLARFFHSKMSQGGERLRCGNVQLGPFAPKATALHGETPPLVSIDEPWAYDEVLGDALLAAITPAQQNIPDAQLILFSTVGGLESRWWWKLCMAGRKSINDPNSNMAYIEYSADPATFAAAPWSPSTFDTWHPGITGGLTTAHKILVQDREKIGGDANLKRSYANLWPDGMEAAGRDLTLWDNLPNVGAIPPITECCIGVDVADDRSGASIVVAWADDDKHVHAQVTHAAPGAAWLPSAVASLCRHGRPRALVADPVGHTAAAIPQVEALTRLTVQTSDLATYALACSQWLGDMQDNTLHHDHSQTLRDAMAVVEQTGTAKGVIFDARKSDGPIDALKAATLAAHWARKPARRLTIVS